jgi:hypothetical protein
MHDLDSYLMRCYQLLLGRPENKPAADDEEICACSTLVEHTDQTH